MSQLVLALNMTNIGSDRCQGSFCFTTSSFLSFSQLQITITCAQVLLLHNHNMSADPCNEKLPPSERALASTELLENIFLQLNLRSLLTSAQSVNRSWRQLIQKSSKIQKALFFQPEKKRRGANEPMFNSLSMETFPSLFPQDGGTSSKFSFTSLDMAQTPEKLAAYARSEASWRKMLVQQPPISEFAFMYSEKSMGGDSLEQYSLKVSTTCLV